MKSVTRISSTACKRDLGLCLGWAACRAACMQESYESDAKQAPGAR
jgi:hypothetical protein